MNRTQGFSLVELLVVVAIVAVLVAVGTPSYQWSTKTNRMASEINALVGDFQLARAEAIKQGQTVTVCASSNQTSCNATAWGSGWILFVDPTASGSVPSGTTPLRVQGALGAGDTMTASQATVMFNREGFASNVTGSLLFTLHDQAASANASRCLSVSTIGLLTPVAKGTGGCS